MSLLQQYSRSDTIVSFEVIDNLAFLVWESGHHGATKRDKCISVSRVGQIVCDEVRRQNVGQIVGVHKGCQVMLEEFTVCQCGSPIVIVEVGRIASVTR